MSKETADQRPEVSANHNFGKWTKDKQTYTQKEKMKKKEKKDKKTKGKKDKKTKGKKR